MDDGGVSSIGGTVTVHGLGPLSAYQLELEDHDLTVVSPSGVAHLTIGVQPGEVCSIALARVPMWPIAWLGWGPAWVSDLRFEDFQGAALLTLPAGGGWEESATRARRYGLSFGPERRRRLVAGWRQTEVEALVGTHGIPVKTAHGKRWRKRRVLWPGQLHDPAWLASAP